MSMLHIHTHTHFLKIFLTHLYREVLNESVVLNIRYSGIMWLYWFIVIGLRLEVLGFSHLVYLLFSPEVPPSILYAIWQFAGALAIG